MADLYKVLNMWCANGCKDTTEHAHTKLPNTDTKPEILNFSKTEPQRSQGSFSSQAGATINVEYWNSANACNPAHLLDGESSCRKDDFLRHQNMTSSRFDAKNERENMPTQRHHQNSE